MKELIRNLTEKFLDPARRLRQRKVPFFTGRVSERVKGEPFSEKDALKGLEEFLRTPAGEEMTQQLREEYGPILESLMPQPHPAREYVRVKCSSCGGVTLHRFPEALTRSLEGARVSEWILEARETWLCSCGVVVKTIRRFNSLKMVSGEVLGDNTLHPEDVQTMTDKIPGDTPREGIRIAGVTGLVADLDQKGKTSERV